MDMKEAIKFVNQHIRDAYYMGVPERMKAKDINRLLRMGKKHKEAWDEFIYGLAHINSGSYQFPYGDNKKMTDLECVNKIVKDIEQKYFPKEK